MSPDTAPYLVVGLGNPGADYDGTPHNFGFVLLAELARRAAIRLRTRECRSLTGRGQLAGRPVWLAAPMTYMNLSGEAVQQLLAKQPVAGWMVACDDVDLPFGALRLRERGSAGSHNGLRSLVACLGTQEFTRLRLGIGVDHPIADLAGFVLSRWSKSQQTRADEVAQTAADAVECALERGLAAAMNRYNAPGAAQTSQGN
ncbi:MAG: aminoacyl-tRNA hydrolase [Terriglobales bacterium]